MTEVSARSSVLRDNDSTLELFAALANSERVDMTRPRRPISLEGLRFPRRSESQGARASARELAGLAPPRGVSLLGIQGVDAQGASQLGAPSPLRTGSVFDGLVREATVASPAAQPYASPARQPYASPARQPSAPPARQPDVSPAWQNAGQGGAPQPRSTVQASPSPARSIHMPHSASGPVAQPVLYPRSRFFADELPPLPGNDSGPEMVPTISNVESMPAPVAPDTSLDEELAWQDEMLEKQDVLLELERLQKQQNVRLSRSFTLNDKLADMQFEVRRHLSQIDETSMVRTMGNGIKLACSGLELANGKLGPFLELDGWTSNVTADMSKYDSSLSKLYRKYWRRSNMSPEMELAFALIGSVAMFHFSAKSKEWLTGKPKAKSQPHSGPTQVPFAETQAPRPANTTVLAGPAPQFEGLPPDSPSIPESIPLSARKRLVFE